MLLFHSTKTKNIPAILESGGLLLEKTSDGFLYFAGDVYTAACFQLIHGVKDFSVIKIEIPDDVGVDVKISTDHNEEFFIKLYPKFGKCYYTEEDITVDWFLDIYDCIDGTLTEREEW